MLFIKIMDFLIIIVSYIKANKIIVLLNAFLKAKWAVHLIIIPFYEYFYAKLYKILLD